MTCRFNAPNTRRALVCLSLALWLILTLILPAIAEAPVPAWMRLPVVEPCEDTPSRLKTTWSCVWFGSYPASEVVDSAWNCVDGDALQEGDVIRDDVLFQRLERADWRDDAATLDGERYVRVGLDSAPAATSAEQHYALSYDRPWHYFRVSPLRWRVLDIADGKALLLADRMPDSVPFNVVDEEVTWDGCTLRSWLNGYGADANLQGIDYSGQGFIDRAFTDGERAAIVPTPCENLSNRDYGTSSGADTEDRLFLLSNAQVFEGECAGRYGFHPGRDYDDPAKRFTSTTYAKRMGAWWSPVADYSGNSFWFMRTSGYTPRSVTYVCDFGYIYSKGTLVTCGDAGVLPALWIDLSLATPADAGERASTDILHAPEEAGATCPVPALSNPLVVTDASAPGGAYTVWNAVTFGRYPQTEILPGTAEDALPGQEIDAELFRQLDEAADGDEATVEDMRYVRLDGRWFRCDPIVWRVLEVSEGTALLLADRGLDCVPWHGAYSPVFWEASNLRDWLNGVDLEAAEGSPYAAPPFIDTAFTEQERRAIAVSDLVNASNYYFGTACGSGTHDRVFLLSEAEVFSSDAAVKYGFRPSDAVGDPGRRLAPTAYALARGAWRSELPETEGIGFWMLRTNGYTRDNAVYVGEKGYLYNRGIPVTCADATLVPALRVRLGSAPIERVEDISSTGK